MKKIICLFVLLFAGNLFGQSLSVFDIDASNFPSMKAKFYAFNEDDKQLRNLSPADFEITENDEPREIISVSCPPEKLPLAISSVLTIDISGSMKGQGLLTAKAAATSWINALPLGKSECAITSFDDKNYFNQDFTTDRQRLLNALTSLGVGGGTDFNAGFINKMSGALLAAENAKYRKVVVFLTDGHAEGDETAIIQKANQMNAVVYCVALNNSCPSVLRNIAIKTGGMWFDNVTNQKEAEDLYLHILKMAQGDEPCEIQWESRVNCEQYNSAELTCLSIGENNIFTYSVPTSNIAELEIIPNTMQFGGFEPNTRKDSTILVRATNSSFKVEGINISNPDYKIHPTYFSLKAGESKILTISFTPSDSGYSFCLFDLKSTPCEMSFYAVGGFPYVAPETKTLKLTHPNGGEEFLVGSDTIITWEGISPADSVGLDYSVNEGKSWKNIAESATGHSYKWDDIPLPAGDQCLMKVRQNSSSADTNLLWISSGHTGTITGMDLSPDGTRVVSSAEDNSVRIWDITTGVEIIALSGHTDWVMSANWSPDGTKIASASADNTIIIWDAATGTLIRTLSGHTDEVNTADWSPDGLKIVSGSKDETIKIWDVETGAEIRTLTGHSDNILCVNWSPDGTQIVSGSYDRTIKIWDAFTGAEIRSLSGHSEYIWSVRWSPDGTKILSGSGDKTAKIWKSSTGDEILNIDGHNSIIRNANWSPDGSKIATSSYFGSIKIWDAVSGAEIRTLTGHKNNVLNAAWSPDGTKIISGSKDYTIRVWDVATGTEIRRIAGHSSEVSSVSWSPDGSKVASGSWDNTVKIWNAVSGSEIMTFKGHTGVVTSISWSPDGSKIVSGSVDNTIKIWNAETGEVISTISGDIGRIHAVDWSPDGSKIASGNENGYIKIWDAETGMQLFWLKNYWQEVVCIVWNPAGTKIATCSHDKNVVIWDAETREQTVIPASKYSIVYGAAWSPDGLKIVSCGWDNTIRVWDVESGEEINTLIGHNKAVISVDWSPDGSKIASGGSDDQVKIWDAYTGSEIRNIEGHTNRINSVNWSPDGSKIASGSEDKTVRVWEVGLRVIQYDISDSLFSIVAPTAASRDIYMGKIITNTIKDLIITDFITNTGAWPCRIDSIYIQGADAQAFMLVGGIPQYIVEENKAHLGEFRFMPTEARYYEAQIVIITQAYTLYQTISGDGIDPTISAIPDFLDFGIVEVTEKSVLTEYLIKNISTQNITIDSTVMLGPDYEQFNIENGGGSFTLAPDEERELTISFAPKHIGRTSGQIGFYFNQASSPAIAQLFGKGIGGNLRMLNDSAYPGERRTLKIVMDNVDMNKFVSVIESYDITFSVDRTTLAPTESIFFESVRDDRTIINYSGTVENSQAYIAAIEFAVALGQYEVSDTYIEEVIWYDHDGNLVEFDTEFIPGTFTLLGICREGGDRLIKPVPQAGIKSISPNPAENKLNIEFTINEPGYTEISIYNILGEKVKTLFAENVSEPGDESISADIKELGSGQYLIVFKTGAFIQSSQFIILK